MKKRNIVVSFPLDRRTDYSRNDLLDGTNHEIEVDQISTFDLDNQHFYIVNGFDITRGCGIRVLLIRNGNILRKVPLLDYGELDRYAINPRVLEESEVQSLLDRNGYYISAMPLTTISNIVAQSKQAQSQQQQNRTTGNSGKQKIMVFYDMEGRKFILSSAAEYLGLPRPRSIKYLPLKNFDDLAQNHYIYGPDWYRLLSEAEYDWIRRNFDIRREEVKNVDVVEYQEQYFVIRPVFENNNFGLAHAFYNFGDNFFDCVQINGYQKNIIDTYYTTDYQKRRLIRIDGDPSRREPEPWPEDTDTIHFRR